MSGNYAEQLAQTEIAALVEQLGSFFDRFGFKRNIGRIWAILYLSPGPLTQREIGELLDVSAGLVSASLKELEHWNAIRQVSIRGERTTQYEAEEKLLRIVASILVKRELHAVRALGDAVIAAGDALPPSPWRNLITRRLQAIEDTTRLYEALVGMIRQMSHFPMRHILNLVDFFQAARFLDHARRLEA